MTADERERDEQDPPEQRPGNRGTPGAEGGEGSADRDTPPGLPSEEDESALGDTDQHSSAQA